jgi:hypothetical protein
MKLFNQKPKHKHIWIEKPEWRYRECDCGAFEALVGPSFLGNAVLPARWVSVEVNKKMLAIIDRRIDLLNTQQESKK